MKHVNVSVRTLSYVHKRLYLKRIAATSAINGTDSVSTNVTNTMPTNMTKTLSINAVITVSINFDNKEVIYKVDCYIMHTILLVIILLFITAIICYHCTKYRSKQKRTGALTI